MEANEAAINVLGGLVTFLISLAILLVLMWPYVKIVQKAGYSGWHVLLDVRADRQFRDAFRFRLFPVADRREGGAAGVPGLLMEQ